MCSMQAAGTHELSIETLETEIAALARELSVRLERWLSLIAEFDRRAGGRRWGFRGTAEWLAATCGIGLRAAREHVRVARRLGERPLVREAFASGDLSYSKVRAITRAPDEEDEAALVDLARASTAGEVEHVVRGLRTAASAQLAVANHAHARRYLDWRWEADGSLSFRGRLAGDDAAAFVEAIETGAAALQASPAPALAELFSSPPQGAQRADALAEIVLSGCPRTQVVLHVDDAALACTAAAGQSPAGDICAFEEGPALPSEAARRVACDAEVTPAKPAGGGRCDYGRTRRVVSPSLRRALERRDQRCRFPGCDRRHGLHAHHIRHWAHGGPTNRDNLILLCRFHHRLVHEDGFTIASRGSEPVFRRPDGRPVPHPASRTEWDPPPVASAA